MRGGSFLCNDAYCSGYRVASRMNQLQILAYNILALDWLNQQIFRTFDFFFKKMTLCHFFY